MPSFREDMELDRTVAFPHLPENTKVIDEVGEIKIDQSNKQPLLIGGGGSLLSGLLPYLTSINLPGVSNIYSYIPPFPGARDPAAINLLGAIAARSSYRGTLEDNYAGVSTLSRNVDRGE